MVVVSGLPGEFRNLNDMCKTLSCAWIRDDKQVEETFSEDLRVEGQTGPHSSKGGPCHHFPLIYNFAVKHRLLGGIGHGGGGSDPATYKGLGKKMSTLLLCGWSVVCKS